MPDTATSDLPIHEVLPQLRAALAAGTEAVLQAPPGAGKTTVVPLDLLHSDWLAGGTILMVEPRRMAARAAAQRMAQLLDEPVGQAVGYRIRLDTCVSAATRIEVITEGILSRRLQSDPALDGVGLVIFDEFHERSLDSDLGLALALQARELFREAEAPLRLLAMSATLDGEAVAALLGNAPVITSKGRQYPVQVHYGSPYQLRDSIIAPLVDTVLRALHEQSGSVLVFLPGQAEIRRANSELAARLARHAGVSVCPLYGGLSLSRQQAAIAPAAPGARKVVLATNIAETSLTIEGIHTVVDSGLERQALFDTGTGITRLATRRISRASAEQRAGRAGRLGPGACYRLWSEEQQRQLAPQATPEILQADLAPLALQLLAWGVQRPTELRWLDAPPAGPYRQALEVLAACDAVFSPAPGQWQLSPHGVRLAQMPLHPRLAHMLLLGCDIHAGELACLLAALLAERNPLADSGADLQRSMAVLLGDSPCPKALQGWYRRIWDQARRYARISSAIHQPRAVALQVAAEDALGVLLAAAWPDRIARLRSAADSAAYQLANGRSARLPAEDELCGETWLAVAEVGGRRGDSEDRIFSAVPLTGSAFDGVLSSLVEEREIVAWDDRSERFQARRTFSVGNIELRSESLQTVSAQARGRALLDMLQQRGLAVLPWTPALLQWRARVQLLHDEAAAAGTDNPWPDLSDAALLAGLEQWLLPWLDDVQRLSDFARLDLRSILQALLPWPQPLELERLAPERIAVPSGSSIAVDYSQSPPVLAVKLQEMFGCEDGPRICNGGVALCIHLLSPAGRPLQVTTDLASFWRNGYAEVRKEMRGRYPKHPWPEDPVSALPTRHTRARQAQEAG
ncbi:ATP-dependent helicase HrpB [Parahaliea aestuarii]|uniref:ATP-dependent helicase HrpB n=1 Tax=Parahaliea aestuarii TaxID=1852021 RepID=A0A5C8ZR80_9GAMM|nr:ATP-dependent helicase HrpB [Parahaliea aestuarii]TXS91006.1 ATP-dependent helicase HrpB [Parahaliea aestuarii]